MPNVPITIITTVPGIFSMFYDLFERPGAIYQCRNRLESTNNEVKNSSAFDINYFTMGFEGFENGASNNNNGSDSDACFIRTVKY